jgi:hypothetical protein
MWKQQSPYQRYAGGQLETVDGARVKKGHEIQKDLCTNARPEEKYY